jgi:hypothetical protein
VLGNKVRQFTPVGTIALDELVPADHFYRHLEQVLDLTFVRQWVQDDYAATGHVLRRTYLCCRDLAHVGQELVRERTPSPSERDPSTLFYSRVSNRRERDAEMNLPLLFCFITGVRRCRIWPAYR